jgi:hypothetical protein
MTVAHMIPLHRADEEVEIGLVVPAHPRRLSHLEIDGWLLRVCVYPLYRREWPSRVNIVLFFVMYLIFGRSVGMLTVV